MTPPGPPRPDPHPRTSIAPTRRDRLLLAAAVAVVSAVLVVVVTAHGRGLNAFDQLWVGARAMLAGTDPYALVGPGRALAQKAPNYYPATAMIAVLPLAWLELELARAVFFGLSAGVLAFAATRDGYARMPMFLSGSFMLALLSQQWAPLLTASLFLPAMAWAYAAKPNIGLALFAARPTRAALAWAAAGAIVLGAASLALRPSWPAEWVAIARSAPHIRALVRHPAGPLVLLALLRWRRPEARLLVALACVPHSTLFYEALPLLFVVPETERQVRALWALSWIGTLVQIVLVFLPGYDFFGDHVYVVGELMLALVYLPCVILVLRRPNVAPADLPLPAWVESVGRALSRLRERVTARGPGGAAARAWSRANAPITVKQP